MKINANRRSFLKGACVGAGVVLSSSFLEAKNEVGATRDLLLSFKHNINFAMADEVSIWQPLAMLHDFQTPYNLKALGNYSDYSISNDDHIPLLHAVWRNEIANKDLEVSLNVKAHYTKGSINMPFSGAQFSKEDRYIRTDGEIAQIAASIINNADSKRNNAKKLFAWVANNISSENGRNISGIRSIVTSDGKFIMRGEDISASSVFVALCRSCGIKAVEAFGVKIDEGRHGIKDGAQSLYSRSAIKIDNAWIPNDVMLAIGLKEHSKLNNEDIINIAFDEWDNNWALFNFARDIKVSKDSNTLLSAFANAYGEIDGAKLSSYDMTHFNTQMA